jgi:hypothetical protein
MWKNFLTPEFFKILIIAGVVIFSLIWIRGIINDFVHLNGQSTYQVRPDSTEKQIQQLVEERGYFKGLAVSLQAQIDARQESKTQIINQGKKQIQNYQNQSQDEQLKLWNEQFKKFIK